MAPAIGRYLGPSCHLNRNHGPPQSQSSKRAAQVVNNLSRTTGTKGQLKGDDRESFEQLLSEMLNASNDSSGEGSFTEADFSTNYNLVSVVTRAGLDVLLEDDPFANVEHLISVATGSLTVLSAIFQKHPDLLFDDPPNDVPGGVVQPPMYIWLLPRLLVLVGRRQLDDLQDALANALRSIVRVASQSMRSATNSTKLFEYLRGCVRGLLSVLDDASQVTLPSLDVLMPSEDTLQKVSPSLPFGSLGSCQVTFRDPGQVCLVLLNLICIHVSPASKHSSSSPVLGMKNHVSFVLDHLIRVYRTILCLEQTQRFACPRHEIATFVLRFFRDLLDDNVASQMQPGMLHKTIAAEVRWEVLLLRWSIDDHNSPLQKDLSQALNRTVQLLARSDICISEVESLLAPAICLAAKDEEGRAPITSELEVRTSMSRHTCDHSI